MRHNPLSHQGLIEIFSNQSDLLLRVTHQRSTSGVRDQPAAIGKSARVNAPETIR